MSGGAGIRYLELGSSDLDRSREFYAGLLGLTEVVPPDGDDPLACWFDAGPALVKVVLVDEGDPGSWRDDDLQLGMRHAGFKTGDVDGLVARLQAAGTRVTAPPRDVLGNVRIAFFLDPDGARLELVQGALDYERVDSPDLVAAERTGLPSPDAPPRFDHVGLTTADLDRTVDFWAQAGFRPIGEIRHHDDPRGFLMAYLGAGGTVLEIFSFDVPKDSPPTWEERRLGLRGIGVAAPTSGIDSLAGLRVVVEP